MKTGPGVLERRHDRNFLSHSRYVLLGAVRRIEPSDPSVRMEARHHTSLLPEAEESAVPSAKQIAAMKSPYDSGQKTIEQMTRCV